MSDNRLDDLRVVLRERAGSDPDTEALLAATHAGVRRHRQRRRVAGALGITVGALVVAGVVTQGVHQRPRPAATPPVTTSPVLHVATPRPLAPPALPFTVGYLPADYMMENWEINTTLSIVRYSSGTHPQSLMVTMGTHDRTSSVVQPQPVTVNGKPGLLGRIADERQIRLIVWQIVPGEWAAVQGNTPEVSDAMLSQVAASVTTAPTPVTSAVRIAALPAGWQVQDRTGPDVVERDHTENVSICPASVAPVYEDFSPSGCAAVHLETGLEPSTVFRWTGGSGPSAKQQQVPLTQEIVDGTALLVTADGQTVEKQVDSGHYVEVTGNEFDPKAVVDPAILRRLAIGTSLG